MLVYGGGWCCGDKVMLGVVVNKVVYWVLCGVVVILVNYCMLFDMLLLE